MNEKLAQNTDELEELEKSISEPCRMCHGKTCTPTGIGWCRYCGGSGLQRTCVPGKRYIYRARHLGLEQVPYIESEFSELHQVMK